MGTDAEHLSPADFKAPDWRDKVLDWVLPAAAAVAIWYLFFLIARWLGYPEVVVACGIVGVALFGVQKLVEILPDELQEPAQRHVKFTRVPFIVFVGILTKCFPTYIVPNALAANVTVEELHQNLPDYAGAKVRVRGIVTEFRQGSRHPFEPGHPAISTVLLQDGDTVIEIRYDHEDDELVPKVGDEIQAVGIVALPKHGNMDVAYKLRYGRSLDCFLATDMTLVRRGGPDSR